MRCLKLSLLAILVVLCQRTHAETVVFAAASLTDVLNEIVTVYQTQTGKAVKVSYASSSILAKQIEEGAPAGIFISADRDWMKYLNKRDLIDGESFDLAQNRLVLIAPTDSKVAVTIGKGMNLAAVLGKDRLATGDPASVPVGKYARAALEYYGEWEAMESRIIPLDNVRVALIVVEAREASLGVVYATDARRGTGVKVLDVFPEESHPPIVYPVGLVKEQVSQEASDFFAFLQTRPVTDVLTKHGFIVAPQK